MRAGARREILDSLHATYGVSIRNACELLSFTRSSYYYVSRKDPRTALRLRLKELATARPRFGYRRLHVLLRREGWSVNLKLVYRLYCEEALQVRTRLRRRKIATQPRLELDEATQVNERWSMDFVADQLADGRRWRALAVIDQYSRECLALHADFSIGSRDVGEVLDAVVQERGQPVAITCDNGTEFTSRYFDAWAYFRKIQLDFIRPGKPVENAFIESFNGRLREECLSQHWFESLDEVRTVLHEWRTDYNETRPHSSLGDLAPAEYVGRLLAGAESDRKLA